MDGAGPTLGAMLAGLRRMMESGDGAQGASGADEAALRAVEGLAAGPGELERDDETWRRVAMDAATRLCEGDSTAPAALLDAVLSLVPAAPPGASRAAALEALSKALSAPRLPPLHECGHLPAALGAVTSSTREACQYSRWVRPPPLAGGLTAALARRG